jgi:hypothetical protein
MIYQFAVSSSALGAVGPCGQSERKCDITFPIIFGLRECVSAYEAGVGHYKEEREVEQEKPDVVDRARWSIEPDLSLGHLPAVRPNRHWPRLPGPDPSPPPIFPPAGWPVSMTEGAGITGAARKEGASDLQLNSCRLGEGNSAYPNYAAKRALQALQGGIGRKRSEENGRQTGGENPAKTLCETRVSFHIPTLPLVFVAQRLHSLYQHKCMILLPDGVLATDSIL